MHFAVEIFISGISVIVFSSCSGRWGVSSCSRTDLPSAASLSALQVCWLYFHYRSKFTNFDLANLVNPTGGECPQMPGLHFCCMSLYRDGLGADRI